MKPAPLLVLLCACTWEGDKGESADSATLPSVTECAPLDTSSLPVPEMVEIPAGTFWMGSSEDELGAVAEQTFAGNMFWPAFPEVPRHEVTLTRAYQIGAYEITDAQFRDLLGEPTWAISDCDNCPAMVTWWLATCFANALSVRAGLETCYACEEVSGTWGPYIECTLTADPYACEGYRLPTEAEWEYAARAGSTAAYPNGANLQDEDDLRQCDHDVVLDDGSLLSEQATYCDEYSGITPVPGGTLHPNAWGLFDTSGNAWEFVNDGLSDYPSEAQVDPYVPLSDDEPYYVMRGGDSENVAEFVRSATRSADEPGGIVLSAGAFSGFRIARTAD